MLHPPPRIHLQICAHPCWIRVFCIKLQWSRVLASNIWWEQRVHCWIKVEDSQYCFMPCVLPPSHKSCIFIVRHPDSLSSGSTDGSEQSWQWGHSQAAPPHPPHLGWCVLAQERAEAAIPSHQLFSAQPALSLQGAEGRCIFQHPDTRESLSPSLGYGFAPGNNWSRV